MSRRCKSCDQELPNDIWKDPAVMAALKEGRAANDIMVLICPKCNRYGYYNEGSSFCCRFCNRVYYVLSSENEFAPVGRCYIDLAFDTPVSLADTVTVTTDGYHNETQNPKS